MIHKADFHIHSCVSPCGHLSMSPTLIAKTLKEKGITMAALTDHNTALNCPTFKIACEKEGIIPFFGIEVQSIEEVHVVCLFSELEKALTLSNEIYDLLPAIPYNPKKMGDQVYVDENEEILGQVDKFLITSADASITDIANRVHKLGGLVIPAHVDRGAFSLTSQLGFIPKENWDALELAFNQGASQVHPYQSENLQEVSFELCGYPVITASDAHYPNHIATKAFEFDDLDLPLQNADGSGNIISLKKILENRGPK
ncbi:MAG: PHP domain-containing protein [Spirochaetaceae bacterium]|nr:PHP domain-containing protein [Spirochaetaceae bacterium]